MFIYMLGLLSIIVRNVHHNAVGANDDKGYTLLLAFDFSLGHLLCRRVIWHLA